MIRKSVGMATAVHGLSSDFINGFDAGISLSEAQFSDFNCPLPEKAKGVGLMKMALKNVQLIGSMFDEMNMEPVIVRKLDTLFDIATDLPLLFDDEFYDSGDFCRGLIFAYEGAELLKIFAETQNHEKKVKYVPNKDPPKLKPVQPYVKPEKKKKPKDFVSNKNPYARK